MEEQRRTECVEHAEQLYLFTRARRYLEEVGQVKVIAYF